MRSRIPKDEPPLLTQRMEAYDIERMTFQPMDDFVVVFRLPEVEMKGRLIIPLQGRSPHSKGVLLKMGPRAKDVLESNGIEAGHIVLFERFAGAEVTDVTVNAEKAESKLSDTKILILRCKQIIGSDDLAKELASGKAKYVRGKEGRYVLERKMIGGRVQKLLALAACPSATPAERETARRIAQETTDGR